MHPSGEGVGVLWVAPVPQTLAEGYMGGTSAWAAAHITAAQGRVNAVLVSTGVPRTEGSCIASKDTEA
jgi:hypothetical protein